MKYLQNAVLLLSALAFAAFAGESMFYLLNSASTPLEIVTVESTPNAERLDFFHYHPVYGYSGRPNVSKEFYGRIVTHNSKGIRGPEVEYRAADHVKRIAFIGDSQTWGWAVGDDETISSYVSGILNEKSGEPHYETLNFGATGYGIDQSYLRFIAEGVRYNPDYVVYTYFADNDIWETASKEAWGVEKPYFYEKEGYGLCLSNVPPRRASGWPSDSLENKFDFNKLKFGIAGVEVDFANTQTVTYFKSRSVNTSLFGTWGIDGSEPLQAVKKHIGCVENEPAPELPHWEDKIQLAVKLIERIKVAAEQNGAQFIVVTKPLETDYKTEELEPNYQTVLSRLAMLGMNVIDLYPIFKNTAMPAEVLFMDSGHLTPYGNRLVAENVAAHIHR